MSNQNQEDEKFGRTENSSANQSGQSGQNQAGNTSGQTNQGQGGMQQGTQNSNENSASGANKGPAGSYNENDANSGSKEQRENTGNQGEFTGEHDAQLGTQSRAGSDRDESGTRGKGLDDAE